MAEYMASSRAQGGAPGGARKGTVRVIWLRQIGGEGPPGLRGREIPYLMPLSRAHLPVHNRQFRVARRVRTG